MLKLTYPVLEKENGKDKLVFNIMEILWHTIIPLLFFYLGQTTHPFFHILIIFTMILRLRG